MQLMDNTLKNKTNKDLINLLVSVSSEQYFLKLVACKYYARESYFAVLLSLIFT